MTPHGKVLSVSFGISAPLGADGAVRSGINKQPTSCIDVRDPGDRLTGSGSGVVGDDIVDREHHGGDRQAVYAVAREELDYWEGALGRTLECGAFGENLSTTGIDLEALRVGSLIAVGGGPASSDRPGDGSARNTAVVLEVCSPRIPCATFATHMAERGWVKTFAAHGRPGVYFAVREPGQIVPGMTLTVTHTPDHDITVADLFAAYYGDLDGGQRVLDAAILPTDEHKALAAKIARGLAGPAMSSA